MENALFTKYKILKGEREKSKPQDNKTNKFIEQP